MLLMIVILAACADTGEQPIEQTLEPTVEPTAEPIGAIPSPSPPGDFPTPDVEVQTAMAVEISQPFNPVEDCPEVEDSPRSDMGPLSAVVSDASSESGQSMKSEPYEEIVSVNEYSPDGGNGRNHIANGVLLGESGRVATAIDFSTYPRCLEVVLRDGTTLPARISAVHADSGATILEVPQVGIHMGVFISPGPIYTETSVRMYRIRSGDSPSMIEAAAANAGSEMLWVLAKSKELTAGDAIFDSDGMLVGLVKPGRWQGATISLRTGGAPTRLDYPGLSGMRLAVKAQVFEVLSGREPDDGLLDVPVAFHFGEAGVADPDGTAILSHWPKKRTATCGRSIRPPCSWTLEAPPPALLDTAQVSGSN